MQGEHRAKLPSKVQLVLTIKHWSEDMAIEIINLSIALFFLWAFIYYCYRDYRFDRFREELFVIRAELFEFAASGQVPFNSPEYSLLRNFINQLIRYAH